MIKLEGHYRTDDKYGRKWYAGRLINTLTGRSRPTLKRFRTATLSEVWGARVAHKFTAIQALKGITT